jgi:hypothetical protein
MGLVDYSDSDASDVEEKSVIKPTPILSKPTFQKVVDRSNPGKIRVSLPQAALKDDTKHDEPPAKRAKIGNGGLSGFNSFLPAPKHTGQAANPSLGDGNTVKKGGLGAGVSLKTGAAPGFSREPEPERDYTDELDDQQAERPSTAGGSGLSLPEPVQVGQKSSEEVKLVGRPLMFKPLSVARKPAKKKKAIAASIAPGASTTTTPVTAQTTTQKPERPKISLFSMGIETSSPALASNTEYQPMIYGAETEEPADEELDSYAEPSYEDYTPTPSQTVPPAVPTPPVSQSLDDIAGDLNLSAAERRQLFGRQKGGRNNGMQAATRVINFNTDKEYLHNEELRAAGEQVVHNPVRAIAPGKHSLKQLVNAAQSQKEALEESFAKGKSNRAEASSRYGW